MKTSSRIVWKLYEVQLRCVSPSKWSIGLRRLARIGRWQPKQLVTQDVWQL